MGCSKADPETRSWVQEVYLEGILGNPGRAWRAAIRERGKPLEGGSEQVSPETAAAHHSGVPLGPCAGVLRDLAHPGARNCVLVRQLPFLLGGLLLGQ